MSTTTSFLTMPIMRDAVIDSATSNSADAIANLIDFNLDTVWTPSSTAQQTITVDTQSVVHASPIPSPIPTPTIGVMAAGIWIANSDVDFSVSTGSGMTVRALFSDDDGVSDPYAGTAIHNYEPNGGSMFWFTFSEQNARYWQFQIDGLSGTLPQVGQIFFLTTRTLNARPEFPKRDEPLFHNNVANLTGGRKKVSAQSLNSQQIFDRNFTLINDTEKTTLENVYKDSQGSLLPFIYQESTTMDEAFICRLQQEKLDAQEIDFAYFKANMKFEQLPFILDGDSL